MKILLALLIPLFSFAAHEKGHSLVDWSWLGSENELYLKLELEEGLKFDPVYFIHSDEKLQACESSCKPLKTSSFQTKIGEQLTNIQILTIVENTLSPKEVFYKIRFRYFYLLEKDGQRTSQIVEQEFEDLLLNSTIDVTLEPLFYTFIDDEKTAVIVFQNLFRCMD